MIRPLWAALLAACASPAALAGMAQAAVQTLTGGFGGVAAPGATVGAPIFRRENEVYSAVAKTTAPGFYQDHSGPTFAGLLAASPLVAGVGASPTWARVGTEPATGGWTVRAADEDPSAASVAVARYSYTFDGVFDSGDGLFGGYMLANLGAQYLPEGGEPSWARAVASVAITIHGTTFRDEQVLDLGLADADGSWVSRQVYLEVAAVPAKAGDTFHFEYYSEVQAAVTAVPEPASLALWAAGLLLLGPGRCALRAGARPKR